MIDGGAGNDTIGFTALALQTSGTLSGGDGVDTITASSASTGSFILGGAGADSIRLVNISLASINGGDGNDTINWGNSGSSAFNAITGFGGLGTINGGSGSDSIVLGWTAGASAGMSAAGTAVTAGTILNYVYGSGDTLAFTTNLNFQSANWQVTNGTVAVVTAYSAFYSTLMSAVLDTNSATGNVAVFDAGDDLIIGIGAYNGNAGSTVVAFINVIGGGNLITNTAIATAGNYNAVASNFAFSLSTLSGGTNGLNITFS